MTVPPIIISTAKAYPIATISLILAVLLGIAAYFYLPGIIHDYQAEQHTENQLEIREQTEELKTEAESKHSEGQVYKNEAEKSAAELTKTKSEIKDKKANVKPIEKKLDKVGNRPISDSDVPSNDELCARANALGIACTIKNE